MRPVDFSLYLVTDRHQTGRRSLLDVCQAALNVGVRAIQLREKDLSMSALLALARDLEDRAKLSKATLLINDRIDIALATGGLGVHLPSTGFPVAVARQLVGRDRLIGVSTHSATEAVQAESEGADFIVLGPIYDTPSKRQYGPPIGMVELERACAQCHIPIFAIGGMTTNRVKEVRHAGAYGVAVMGAVMAAGDVERVCGEFLHALSA